MTKDTAIPFKKPPKEIILNFDATDDPVHGGLAQGKNYLSADSGFCRDLMMDWCDKNGMD